MTLFLSLFLGVLGLDIFSKYLVRSHIPLGSEINLLPFFSVIHVQNTGIAFGLFQNRNVVFIVIGLVMTAFILFWARRLYHEDRFSCYVLALVLGGAYGNLADRIFFGCVTDFLDFFIGRHHYWAFNVADSSICVGAALLLWRNFVIASPPKADVSKQSDLL